MTVYIVVPAKAGTHNHRLVLLHESRRPASLKTNCTAYGSGRSPGRHQLSAVRRPPSRSSGSARRLRKNLSTSRDRISAVDVSWPDADSTEVADLLVSPMAPESEVMLATNVSLPWAADWALTEISRVAKSCSPTALAMLEVTSLMSRTALPISRTASTALRA